MDIRKWKAFLASVDYGSFTKAGEALGYTQSGITQMIKSLEQEVGFPLLNKGHAGVTITKEGEAILPSVRSFSAADEALQQEISFFKDIKKGTIKIGSFNSCSIHWLPEIIQKFHDEYPNVIFKIRESGENEITDWIMERKIDIGFTSYQKNRPYQFIHLFDDPLLAVLPKEHPYCNYEEIPMEWFENIPFLISDYAYDNDIHKLLRKYKVKPDIQFTTTSDFSILSMTEHNLGVTILPELMLKGCTGNFEVRNLKPQAFRKLGMAVYSMENLSPAMKIFIKYTQNSFLIKSKK